MDMNNELIDERAVSPVGQPFRVCASKTETEALELTKTNPNILCFSSDTNTIIFNGVMRTNPTPDLNSVLKKTYIIDNTSTNDNTKVLSAKQGKLLNDTKLNKTDVIGNLTNTDDTKALAASQGKILNDKKIDKTAIENTVNSSDVNKVLSAAMGKFLNDNKVAKSEIVDDTSTDDVTKPLSARQGKSLQDEITALENNIQYLQTSIPTKTSQLTNDSNYVTTNNVLTKTNTTVYNPTDNYHPATKKYVDDKVAAGADSNTNFVDFDFSKVNALTTQSTAQEVKDAFVGYEKLKTDSIIRLIDISESSDWFDSSNGHVEAFYTNVDGASFSFCYIDKSNNQIVKIIANGENGNIELYRIDIIQDIPTNITKYKIINITDGSLLTINKNLKGTEAEQHINKIFGSIHTIENIVNDICENKSKYYIHSYNNKYNCLEMSAVYAYFNGQEEYNLQFNISYYTNNGPVSKRIGMLVDSSDISTCTFYLEDILVSDNLQRVVKRTASEYESTTSKDASTMYGVTE